MCIVNVQKDKLNIVFQYHNQYPFFTVQSTSYFCSNFECAFICICTNRMIVLRNFRAKLCTNEYLRSLWV